MFDDGIVPEREALGKIEEVCENVTKRKDAMKKGRDGSVNW
jgi:hypothetical protein